MAINSSPTPDPGTLQEALRFRLQQALPGLSAQERMTGRVLPLPSSLPADARASAVMMLLFQKSGSPHLILIQRTEDGRTHGGQIALPGGRLDDSDADLRATALRETNEEIGIHSADIDILGALTPLYIPVSNYIVHPFLGWMTGTPKYMLSVAEVDAVHEIPLDLFTGPAHKFTTIVRPLSRPGMALHVPAYHFPQLPIPLWGATAMMLSELEALLAELPGGLV